MSLNLDSHSRDAFFISVTLERPNELEWTGGTLGDKNRKPHCCRSHHHYNMEKHS